MSFVLILLTFSEKKSTPGRNVPDRPTDSGDCRWDRGETFR